MQGRLSRGDAAHTVPPTGAKGMNVAVADVHVLSRALAAHYRSTALLDADSGTALHRVRRAQRSYWLTSMLHRCSGATDVDLHRQVAELRTVTESRRARACSPRSTPGGPSRDDRCQNAGCPTLPTEGPR